MRYAFAALKSDSVAFPVHTWNVVPAALCPTISALLAMLSVMLANCESGVNTARMRSRTDSLEGLSLPRSLR